MSKFKVIVVGGGPVGLVAAHGLAKAGIDFVVLESQPVIAKDVGASLVLKSYSLRILAQLGLLDSLRDKGHELIRLAECTQTGKLSQSWPVEEFREDYGAMNMVFHRADLVQLIYDGLSAEDQAKIHLSKKMISIENTDDGVSVTCADGSTYEGSIVLGADGVHSKVRGILRQQMLETVPESEVDAIQPYSAHYKALWCSFPRQYEYTAGDQCITHGEGASLQFLNASKRSWLFVYEKLDKPTNEVVHYTEADVEAFAAKHGEMTIGHRLKVKDVVKHRTGGGLTNLEEGVVKNWSHNRIVLAGDACHKYTPNAGLGLNNGIQDVVALVNELHALRSGQLRGPPPSLLELKGAFGRYQAARATMVKTDFDLSSRMTRLDAWPDLIHWFVDQWVLPYIPWRGALMKKYVVIPSFSQSLCFDFVEGEEPFEGKVPWVHRIKEPSSTKEVKTT